MTNEGALWSQDVSVHGTGEIYLEDFIQDVSSLTDCWEPPQLVQVPMIAIGRTPAIRRNKILGNVFFWVSLFSGFPLLCVLYVVY